MIRRALGAAGLGLIGLVALRVAVRSAHLQWDLRAYHAAARAWLAGLDPYASSVLAELAGRAVPFPFLYPPSGLVVFLPLALLPFPAAAAAWLGLQLLLLAALVELVRRTWLPATERPWIALVAVFGGAASALWGLRSGNVALLETALWMAGLAAWSRDRARVAAALFVAAALWKGWPLAFLALVAFPPGGRRGRPGLALGGLVLGLAALAAPFALDGNARDSYGRLLAGLPMPFPVGDANPSALAFFESLARAHAPSSASPAPLAWALYAAWAAVIVAAGAHLARRVRTSSEAALLAALGATLLHPRPMAYGWTGAALCALALAPPPFRSAPGRVVLAFALAAQGLAAAARHPWTGPVVELGPPLSLLAVWLLAARDAIRTPRA